MYNNFLSTQNTQKISKSTLKTPGVSFNVSWDILSHVSGQFQKRRFNIWNLNPIENVVNVVFALYSRIFII